MRGGRRLCFIRYSRLEDRQTRSTYQTHMRGGAWEQAEVGVVAQHGRERGSLRGESEEGKWDEGGEGARERGDFGHGPREQRRTQPNGEAWIIFSFSF